jgi:hypothetical protein
MSLSWREDAARQHSGLQRDEPDLAECLVPVGRLGIVHRWTVPRGPIRKQSAPQAKHTAIVRSRESTQQVNRTDAGR